MQKITQELQKGSIDIQELNAELLEKGALGNVNNYEIEAEQIKNKLKQSTNEYNGIFPSQSKPSTA